MTPDDYTFGGIPIIYNQHIPPGQAYLINLFGIQQFVVGWPKPLTRWERLCLFLIGRPEPKGTPLSEMELA